MKHSVKSSAILFFTIISFSLLVEGCASYQKKLDSWIGVHQSRLIASWGSPVKTTPDGKGGAILIYEEHVKVYVPGRGETYRRSTHGYGREKDYSFTRQTRFYVDEKGYIYKWETQG